MSSAIMNPSPSSHSSRTGRVSFGAHGASLLLERAKANSNRRPTPDSEAMVSSDDEQPSGQSQPGLRRASTSRPATSWLSDIGQPQAQPARKYSLGGMSVGSNNSQPPTPSSEATPRLTATGSGRNASTVTFSGNIWATDRSAANRFSETPHSPLTLAPLSSDQSAPGSQGRRYSGIGVDIPLKPTFKPSQQRAMSFSAAQQIPSDDDEVALPFHVHRLRTATQANITRKASLSQVREDDDGNEDPGVQLTMDQGNVSQNLLRRAVRQRTFSSNAPPLSESGWNASARRASTLPFTETAVDELDDYPSNIPESRRHSLAHVATRSHAPSSLSSRTYIEPQQYTSHNNNNPSNAFSPSASTTLQESATGSDYFYQHQPHLDEAQVPSEHYLHTMWNEDRQQEYLLKELHSGQQLAPNMGNFGLGTNSELAAPVFAKFRQMDANLGGHVAEVKHPIHENLNRYFNGVGVEQRVLNEGPSPPQVHVPEQRSTGPAKVAPPAPKTYHLIKFKCERAEVYTMPDNTGLTIEKGQLVIVEGDRGYDIGEVEKANISLGEVKALRQSSQEKHFIWLMMFSRARETNPTVRWALSNLDPHNASARHPENDPEPESRSQNFKMIKRLAIPVEFASLQEKEGDETKAKRICQQKVLEHGLDMEILDAEFQLDRHKLTYFYYAEKYINFNELVNDLFKIFKTRIWMSAVNPASFAPGGSRGHGGSPPTTGVAPVQQGHPMSYAGAYGAQSTLAHTREVQAARHEASMQQPPMQQPPMQQPPMQQPPMNSGVQPRYPGVPPIQYTGLPPAFGASYGQNAHASASNTGNAYNSATPVNTGPTTSNSSGFNPYAQPFHNSTWAPNTSFNWGATPPKSNNGQNSSVQSPIGHPIPRNAAPESPRNTQPYQQDRQRKPSTEEDARNEAVRAAFYSKVTSGVQGMSLGDGQARRGSFK